MCVQEPCVYLLSTASVVIRNNNLGGQTQSLIRIWNFLGCQIQVRIRNRSTVVWYPQQCFINILFAVMYEGIKLGTFSAPYCIYVHLYSEQHVQYVHSMSTKRCNCHCGDGFAENFFLLAKILHLLSQTGKAWYKGCNLLAVLLTDYTASLC